MSLKFFCVLSVYMKFACERLIRVNYGNGEQAFSIPVNKSNMYDWLDKPLFRLELKYCVWEKIQKIKKQWTLSVQRLSHINSWQECIENLKQEKKAERQQKTNRKKNKEKKNQMALQRRSNLWKSYEMFSKGLFISWNRPNYCNILRANDIPGLYLAHFHWLMVFEFFYSLGRFSLYQSDTFE